MLATVLLSILRLRTMFHPKFGARVTIKRPPDGAAALPVEVTQTKTRIRRRSVLAESYLGFMCPPLGSGLAFGEHGVHCLVKFSEVVPTHQGLPGHPICHNSPGVRHTVDGRRKTKSESHIAVYT